MEQRPTSKHQNNGTRVRHQAMEHTTAMQSGVNDRRPRDCFWSKANWTPKPKRTGKWHKQKGAKRQSTMRRRQYERQDQHMRPRTQAGERPRAKQTKTIVWHKQRSQRTIKNSQDATKGTSEANLCSAGTANTPAWAGSDGSPSTCTHASEYKSTTVRHCWQMDESGRIQNSHELIVNESRFLRILYYP